MGGPLVVRWALTVAFALAAAYCAASCVRVLRTAPTGRRTAVSLHKAAPTGHRTVPRGPALADDAAHLTMNAAMLAMIWSVPSRSAVAWEMTLFAVAAGWFAVRAVALSEPSGVRRAAAPVTAVGFGGAAVARHPRLACVHHAIGMVAMVWMLAAMGGARAGSGNGPMAGMAGMATVPGGTGGHAGIGSQIGILAGTGVPAATFAVAASFGAYFLVAGGIIALGAGRADCPDRRPGAGRRLGVAAHSVMSAAMGAAMLTLAW